MRYLFIFNKVSRIKQSIDEQTINRVYDLFYGLDEQRIKTVYDDFSISGHVKTHYYFGTYEKETDEFGKITETDYLYTPPSRGTRVLLSGVNITDRGYTGHEHLSPFGDDSNGGF